MDKFYLNIKNETSRLSAVILGTAKSNGPIPKVEDCY
ncbi:MAG: amidinotransferase, partial [Lutimonas sp.]